MDVLDRKDRQGVLAFGTSPSIQAFRTILFGNLIDVIARSPYTPLPDTHRFSIDFEFPGFSKSQLDKIRGSVTPTIRGHHFYKAWGGKISSAVDMTENLLTRGESRGEIERVFNRTISPFFPLEGSTVELDHVKLVGPPLLLGKAAIDRFDEDKGKITLLRRLRGRSVYDGLGVKKSPGDYAITETSLGEWYLITRYFSQQGVLKGIYVNLNTPVELYPRRLRYVDLEVDICVWPDGKMKILDVEVLDNAVADGIVGAGLVEFTRRKTDELIKELRHIPHDPHQPVK